MLLYNTRFTDFNKSFSVESYWHAETTWYLSLHDKVSGTLIRYCNWNLENVLFHLVFLMGRLVKMSSQAMRKFVVFCVRLKYIHVNGNTNNTNWKYSMFDVIFVCEIGTIYISLFWWEDKILSSSFKLYFW